MNETEMITVWPLTISKPHHVYVCNIKTGDNMICKTNK